MSISYEGGGRTIKAMGNERSYILSEIIRIRKSLGEVGLCGSLGAMVYTEPAKTFLFGNSHVWSCDLTHLMCPTYLAQVT